MHPSKVKFDKEGNPILPKKETEVIDLLYEAEQLRYQIQHDVELLKKIETACEDNLRDRVDLTERQGATGKLARIEIEPVRTPRMQDYDKFFAYVVKTKDSSLLTTHFSAKAVKERWDHKKTVPGIEAITVKKVHVHKLKKRGGK